MIVDFHVHFFPDSIAVKTTKLLSEQANIKCYGDGTIHSLLRYMKEDNIDLAINLPIATKEEQVISINRKMIEYNKKNNKVISFGAMHPNFSKVGNIKEELEFISKNGIKGIKLHPEYQEFYPDDPKILPIYEACRDFNLIISFHCGKDIAFTTVHGTPKRFAEVAKIKSLKLVFGHMGGYQMWDEVEHYIMGLHDIYIDTSFTLEMDDWQLKEIILGHGAYKVLFASDFPWQRQIDIVNKIKNLNIGKMQEDMIFYKNALNLLNINH